MKRAAWVMALGAMAWGCGDTTSSPRATGGQATGGGGTAGAASGGKPATPSGGADGVAGVGDDDDDPPIVVTEADPEEPCTPDPLAPRWRDDEIDFASDRPLPILGAGGDLVLMVHNDEGMLRARFFDGQAWSAPELVDGATDVSQLNRVEVTRDGSGALLLWSRESGTFGTWYTEAGGFQPPVALELPTSDFDVVMLSGARAVLGFGSGEGLNAIEFSAAGGLVKRAPVLANYDGIFNWGENGVAGFSASSFVAGPDALIPFEIGQGFFGRS